MVYCPLPKKKGFFFHLLHLGCIVVYVICRDCKILPLMFICETCNQSINLFSDMKVGMLDFIGLNCLWVLDESWSKDKDTKIQALGSL